MVTKTHLVVGAIILFSLLQLLSLGQPATLVFDENHYVKTARMVSLGYPDYNIEHPPLGKRIIATSINFLGDSPWGWRVPSFLFSIATLILTFSLARNFLGEKTALLAGFLLALDPLWIVVSRLGMLDIFATFFAVLFVALTLRYLDKPSIKLAVFSGVALGVSLAVKWVGITLPLFFALIVGI
ncbi:phospholipid carrier-dependent glycosyltransferase, partial [bacterium]|nr:phospholipid carrier-dependent glycosyltransferase [bacterium]